MSSGAKDNSVEAIWGKYLRTRRTSFRDELVHHYMPLVRQVAAWMSGTLPRHVGVDDLQADGAIGLVRAIERFDPEKRSSFSSYAHLLIRGAMIDALRSFDWVPRSVHKKGQEVRTAYERLWNELGREPNEEEMADYLGLPLFDYQQLLVRIRPARMVPLEAEELPDKPAETVESEEQRDVLRQTLGALPEQERKVIAMYFFEGKMLKEIGRVLKVSESRVSQIRSKGLERMRELLGADFSF